MHSQRCQQQIKAFLLIYPRICVINITNFFNFTLLIQPLSLFVSHMIDESDTRLLRANIESLIMSLDERNRKRRKSSMNTDIFKWPRDISNHIFH
jgi:hypothetical protein